VPVHVGQSVGEREQGRQRQHVALIAHRMPLADRPRSC
jgi:hypothetical protein